MKHSGIYRLHWQDVPYFYYGQSCHVPKRYNKHLRLLKKGIHENTRLQNIYNKYGFPLLEIVVHCDEESLDREEQSLLDRFFGHDHCCNLAPCASSTKGYKHTPEALKKIGEKSRLKVFTKEYREKLRNRKPNITMLGKKQTEEARKKMSLAGRGKTKSPDHRRKIGEAHQGAKHYNYGKTLSEDWKKKLSSALSRGNNPRAKKVININTGEIFDCLKDAADHYGLNYSSVRSNRQKDPNYFLQDHQ